MAYSQQPHSAGIGRSSQQSSAHNAARSGTSHGRRPRAEPKWSDARVGWEVRPKQSCTAHTPEITARPETHEYRPSIAQTPGDTRSQGFGFMLPFDVVLPSFSSVFPGMKEEEAASSNWLLRPSAGQPQKQPSALGAAADELAASVDLALQMHGLAVERSLHLPLHLPLRPTAPKQERTIKVDGTTITIHDGPQSWLPQILESPSCCKAELSAPWQRWRPRSLEDLLAQQCQRFVSIQDELEKEKQRVADQEEQLQKHKRERELLLKKCASLSLDVLSAFNDVTQVRNERDDALHALQVIYLYVYIQRERERGRERERERKTQTNAHPDSHMYNIVCIYVCVCMYTYHTYIRVDVCVYVYLCMHVCMYVRMYVNVHVCVRARVLPGGGEGAG